MGALFGFFAITSVLLAGLRTPIFHPAMVSTLIWLAVTIISGIGLIDYPGRGMDLGTVIFVIACHVALLAGIALAGRPGGAPRIAFVPGQQSVVLAYTALIFVALQWAASVAGGNIPIVDTATDLAAARAAHWSGEGDSALQQLARIFGYPTIGYVALAPVFWQHRRFGHFAIAVLAFFGLVDLSLADGGRALLVFAIGMIAAVYFFSRGITVARWATFAVIGAVLVWTLGSSFYLARNPMFERSPHTFVAYNCMDGRLGRAVERAPATMQALALSSCYATTPVHVLDDFLQRRDVEHTWGGYNAGILLPEAFAGTRDDIARYYRSRGNAENPWGTTIRDLWIDFGYGAVIAFALLGLLFGSVARRAWIEDEAQAIRQAVVLVSVLMLAFISPLVIRGLVYPFVATFLVAGAAHLVTRPRRRTPGTVRV